MQFSGIIDEHICTRMLCLNQKLWKWRKSFTLLAANLYCDGANLNDIAKRLLDYAFYPPTIYFSLNTQEALMIEPTGTESKETLDEFIEAMIAIASELKEHPEIVQEEPHDTIVKRMGETMAARKPILKYEYKE